MGQDIWGQCQVCFLVDKGGSSVDGETRVRLSITCWSSLTWCCWLLSGGSIVYISSIGGYRPFPALGAYSVSKTALLGLTKSVAEEVASQNIRVNCVCPGVIKTKFSSVLTTNQGVSDEMLRYIPINRSVNHLKYFPYKFVSTGSENPMKLQGQLPFYVHRTRLTWQERASLSQEDSTQDYEVK